MKPLRDIFPFGPVRLALRWPTFGAQEVGGPPSDQGRGDNRILGRASGATLGIKHIKTSNNIRKQSKRIKQH